ncbi:unnamed protein product, partial [Strongylus vulgaris]
MHERLAIAPESIHVDLVRLFTSAGGPPTAEMQSPETHRHHQPRSPEESHYREKIPHLESALCRSRASEVEPEEPSTSSGLRLPVTPP